DADLGGLLRHRSGTRRDVRSRVQADVRGQLDRAGEEPLPAPGEVLLALLLEVRVVQDGRHVAPRLSVPVELAGGLRDQLLADGVPSGVLLLEVELLATHELTQAEHGAQGLSRVAEVPGLLVLL